MFVTKGAEALTMGADMIATTKVRHVLVRIQGFFLAGIPEMSGGFMQSEK
jgi:hypothetical protein